MSQQGYARLSNNLWRSPMCMKMLAVNPAALGYYIAAVSYASDNLTDGYLDETAVVYTLRVPQDVIDYLVAEGKWEQTDGGWRIHNYDKWQNSREYIEAARAKDRERKAKSKRTQASRKDSTRNPNGTGAESAVNPEKVLNQNQNQNQNTSPDGEVVAAAPAPATETSRDEDRLIDIWAPSPACEAYADDLERAGRPRPDIPALARRFRNKLHARGLAAYRLRPTVDALDAEFRTWLDTEASILERDRPKPTGAKPRPPKPHEHKWDCPHVADLMAGLEGEYSHQRDGWASSEWMLACNRVADQLNQGADPDTALASIRGQAVS